MSLRRRRQQRLQHLHNMLIRLVMHEGRFLSERTNNFLLYNSIFFAGFILLKTQPTANCWSVWACGIISIIGIFFSILHFFIVSHNVWAANFWRATAGLIERDSDFWWPRPRKTDMDKDLDFFNARNRSVRGKCTRQKQCPLKLGGIPINQIPINQERAQRLFGPNIVFGTWLPGIIGFLWLFALIWTIKTAPTLDFCGFFLIYCSMKILDPL